MNRQVCLVSVTIDRSVWYGQAMSTQSPPRASARERLLAAADELFYEEGVRTVGIDRVIERAGVAKASLYNAFGSKDELIRVYLERRHAAWEARLSERLATADLSPRERLLTVFDAQGELFAEPGFHGCALVKASAEAPSGSAVKGVVEDSRAWVRALFVQLASAAGAAAPEQLADQLVLLYDGASVTADLDHDPTAATTARAVAAALVDAATAAR